MVDYVKLTDPCIDPDSGPETTCRNCVFGWTRIKSIRSESLKVLCRRYPPVMAGNGKWEWPEVDEDECCGEGRWKP